ncbi:CVNH domain-containing protein [Nostoc sp.]|uniref:CVNH domain-containing protein n=1 Tax=Nostoc sp. TaxID=1180 RepID=UPI002FF7B57D
MFKFSKYICIVSLIATPILFKQNIALAGGGFTGSCHNIQLNFFTGNGGFSPLTADCYTTTGQIHNGSTNFVDLNAHITNNHGTLAWQQNGGFANSVRNCGINVTNVTVLHCEAGDGAGSWPYSSITLDDEIANYDGNLTVIDGF